MASKPVPSGSNQHGESQPLDPSDEVLITDQMRMQHFPGRGPIMNQYERRQRIGRGQHGEVHVGINLDTGGWVAIKGMNRRNAKEDKMKMLRKNVIQPSPHTPITDRLGSTENKIRKEIAIMKKCRHAHIVRLLEVIDDRMKAKIYMIMEYLGGGEIKWRNTSGEPILHVDQARRICRDAILGLEYLHYQGIIHRDIKPANLLWTEDRQMVKISDFGVSHFSLALRAAAVGPGAALEGTSDPRLLDDSELSKTAGTPSFLAPEVIFEFKDKPVPSMSNPNNLLSTSRSTTNSNSNSTINISPSDRPPITKAIDVWALGATLYCLLFGRIPFHHSGDNAYLLYIHIANSDWGVADTMGFDRIPTGGRHYTDDDTSEGAVVVRILDGMLQKDARNRTTLDVVKSNPWFTRDIQNPAEWLRETSPSKNDMVMVTASETASAMSSLKYRHGWPKRVKQRLSTLLHNVRAHRSSRSVGHRAESQFGTSSAPHLHFGSHQKPRTKRPAPEPGDKGRGVDHHGTKEKGKGVDPREKGKYRSKGRPNTAKHESTPNITTASSRSKSIDRWSSSRENSTLTVAGSSGRSHRRSESRLAHGDSDVDASSPTSSRGDDHAYSRRSGDERPRNRFSLASLKHWRPHRHSSHGSTPLAASTSTLSYMEPITPPPKSAAPSTENQARSDVILGYFGDRNSPLIFARRASSWGEASDYFEDVLSLNSGDEFLEEDAIMMGAGGVSNEPPYGSVTPVGFTTAAEAASAVSLPTRPPQLFIGSPPRISYDSPMHENSFSRQSQVRSQTTSPLAQAVVYGSDLDVRNMPYDGGSDDDSLSYGDVIEDGPYQGCAYPEIDSTSSSQAYEEEEQEDDEDSDEENFPIEVKRRRPSVTFATVPSPPLLDSEPS